MDTHTTSRFLLRPDGTRVRVLVVDDEPDLTEVLAGALRYEGWEVRTAAERGRRAGRARREFAPDAAMLDWMLPDTDGLDAAARGCGPSWPERVRAVPDRARRGRGPDRGDHGGRRRLRDQAVQPGRGAGAGCAGCCAGPGWRGEHRETGWSWATW